MEIENGYRVDTQWDEKMIWQSVNHVSNGVESEISQNVVKLQDKGIRDALIAMGWTPPES